jgi:integrase
MLAAVPKIVGDESAESWRFLLRGLWWSGLRLGEALALRWDGSDGIVVDLSGKYPMLRIPGEHQKSGKDQLYPVAPEFAEFLSAVPERDRRGRVFKLAGVVNPKAPGAGTKGGAVGGIDWVSHVIGRIGRKAGIKVGTAKKHNTKTGAAEDAIKCASAHDLRRSFGVRWSKLVMPTQLMELMRHEDIGTTMQFYVGRDAQSTAEVAWAAFRAAGGNTGNSLATVTPDGGQARGEAKVASGCGEKS